MVKLCGACRCRSSGGRHVLSRACRTSSANVGSYTKAVIINSPNNPSGVMYSEEFIAEIVEFCEKRDLYLIMDDIYHRLIFDGRKPINCWDFAKKDENSKLIIINGVSKQYAMTGFRIGWSVANKQADEVMTNIQGHQTSGPSGCSSGRRSGRSTACSRASRACGRRSRTTATS
jgi:aspartate aminotransferase